MSEFKPNAPKKPFLDYLFLPTPLYILNPFLWFILVGALPLLYTERGNLNYNGHLEPASVNWLIGGFVMMFISAAYNFWRYKNK